MHPYDVKMARSDHLRKRPVYDEEIDFESCRRSDRANTGIVSRRPNRTTRNCQGLSSVLHGKEKNSSLRQNTRASHSTSTICAISDVLSSLTVAKTVPIGARGSRRVVATIILWFTHGLLLLCFIRMLFRKWSFRSGSLIFRC